MSVPAARRLVEVITIAAVWAIAAAAPLALPIHPSVARAQEAAHDAVPLPGPTLDALTVDLDGDGSREVVRLIAWGPDGTAAVEVWRDRDGWERLGEAVPFWRPPTGAERSAAYPDLREGHAMLAVPATAPLRLVRWSEEGRPRALVVESRQFSPTCCTTFMAVDIDGDTGRGRLAGRAYLPAEAVLAVDLDADGTSELILTEPRSAADDGTLPVRLLRWDGHAFVERERRILPRGAGRNPFLLGDTDGRPGDEAAVVDEGGGATLTRLSADRDGTAGLSVEVTPLAVSRLPPAEVRDVTADAAGRLVVVASNGAYVADWRSGGRHRVLASRAGGGRLVGIVGEASATRYVVDSGERGGELTVLDEALRVQGAVAPTSAADAAAAGPLRPYAGALPGGVDGVATVVAGGRLLRFTDEGLLVTESAALGGMTPRGMAGRDDGWVALLPSEPLLESDASGGRISSRLALAGRLSLVPVGTLLTPDDPADPAISLGPGSLLEAVGGSERLTIGIEGVDALVEAPPGSMASLWTIPDGRATSVVSEATATVDATGSARLALLPRGVEPPAAAGVTVVRPTGHTVTRYWQLRILDGPPPLEAEAPVAPLAAVFGIEGRTGPGASVSVNGRAVVADANGQFRADVVAPPWPTDVQVVATDALGQRTEQTLSVVGVLDYRRVPWVTVSVVAIMLGGAALALLAARQGEPRMRRTAAAAELEELEPGER